VARIRPVDARESDAETVDLLRSVKKKMGIVPNLISTMANSPAVARAYLGFSQALAGGKLPTRMREQIALVVGEANSCDYCLAAHTQLAKGAGLTDAEACDARQATSQDPKERVALDFAGRVVRERGMVADADIERLREAGYTEGEISEVLANVALNLFTNYFNHVAGTDIDFPAAPSLCTQATQQRRDVSTAHCAC